MGVAATGTGQVAGLAQPLWLLIPAGFATGATLLSGAMAFLIAGYAGRTRTARAVWPPAILASTAAYTVALWIAGQAQLLADGAGVRWLLAWAVTESAAPAVLVGGTLMTVLAVVALVARGPAAVPRWLSAGPPVPDRPGAAPGGLTALATGLAAGAAGAVVVVANRVLRGAALTEAAQAERFYTVVWIAAVASASAALVLSARSASHGPALAAVAGPAAVGVVVCGLIALNLAQGYLPSWAAIWTVGKLSLAAGSALSLLAVGAALAGRRGAARPVSTAASAALLTALAAAFVAAFPATVIPSVLSTA